MLKILDKIVYIVSLIAAFGLIGAYLSPIINPNTFVFFSLLGLAYPYLLIGNFILLLYWIFRWKQEDLADCSRDCDRVSDFQDLLRDSENRNRGCFVRFVALVVQYPLFRCVWAGVIRKTRGKNYSII